MAQDPHWAHWDQNCERTLWVHFKKYPVGTLVGTFQKNPPHTCWVTTRQIVSGLTKNSQWTHWVNSPLPPVLDGMLAVKIVEGSFTTELFKNFIEGLLDHMNPFPGPNSVIIMDNCRIHRAQAIWDMIEERFVSVQRPGFPTVD